MRRLTFASRFEEGERIDISQESALSSTSASDEEMGLDASTLPLRDIKNENGTTTDLNDDEVVAESKSLTSILHNSISSIHSV